ncbi:CKLF-like MARVEL transmembrane domain-containing protein 1 isoform X4 [Gorilla gorilla gorilla]|uniref:CKLF-like MARVEL transmembrane domain-containing protein 1 isoform X4 n=1 Tax=Gorilla gorilla gorilla TaxID=9595 RepID=UPI00244560AA|nr:CKLF-like MARVEL transmembrane domain-containing protein 1 isoform X4 [Gorilla gorilla gorilla]
MDPEHAKPESSEAPSGNLKQPETAAALASSGSVVSSVPKAQRNISAKTAPRKHTAVSIRSAQSAAAARPQGSEGTAPSRKATTRPPPKPTLPPPTPSAHTESKLLNETVIKERVEGRAKVPYKFTDSLKRFSFSPTGMLKILRLVSGELSLIIGALACFIITQANESFITITSLEICIVVFFILIYVLTLHHLLTYLHWPLLFFITGSYQQYHYSCVPFSSCHLGHARKEKKAFTLCRGVPVSHSGNRVLHRCVCGHQEDD